MAVRGQRTGPGRRVPRPDRPPGAAFRGRTGPRRRDYLTAAALLWGPAGEFAAAEFGRLNRVHFAGSIPPLPIVIGLTAYGKCIGATLSGPEWLESPRITLAPGIFNHGGALMVSDVLVHELIHAALRLRGEEPGHNEAPWCRMVAELSPAVLGRDVNAQPVKPRRVPNPARAADPAAPKTIVVRRQRFQLPPYRVADASHEEGLLQAVRDQLGEPLPDQLEVPLPTHQLAVLPLRLADRPRHRGLPVSGMTLRSAWLTFASATLAAVFQGRRAVQGWLYDQRDRREARRADLAGWSRHGVDTWTVQLAAAAAEAGLDAPQCPAAITVIVCDQHGQPSPVQADRLRRYLENHEHISRNPGPAELAALDQAAKGGSRLALTRARRRRLVPVRRSRRAPSG